MRHLSRRPGSPPSRTWSAPSVEPLGRQSPARRPPERSVQETAIFLIHESDAEPYQLVGRTTRLLVGESSGSRTVTHNVSYFHPGHAPGHVHDPEEEVFYVDEGVGEVWIDGVPFALRPGTVVHTPMGVEHNIHVTGSTQMRIIGSFSTHVIPGRYLNLPPRSQHLDGRQLRDGSGRGRSDRPHPDREGPHSGWPDDLPAAAGVRRGFDGGRTSHDHNARAGTPPRGRLVGTWRPVGTQCSPRLSSKQIRVVASRTPATTSSGLAGLTSAVALPSRHSPST